MATRPPRPPRSVRIAALEARIDALQRVCGAAYQFAGAAAAPVRLLDALSAAANGDPIPDGELLPIRADDAGEDNQYTQTTADRLGLTLEKLQALAIVISHDGADSPSLIADCILDQVAEAKTLQAELHRIEFAAGVMSGSPLVARVAKNGGA